MRLPLSSWVCRTLDAKAGLRGGARSRTPAIARGRSALIPRAVPRKLPAHLPHAAKNRFDLRPCFVASGL
jgi:hypothetical protein